MVVDSLATQEQFERACAGKEKYTSMSAASAALKALTKAGLLVHPSSLQAYRCKFRLDNEPTHYHFGH